VRRFSLAGTDGLADVRAADYQAARL
jgi:hypothetical protein